MNLKYGILPRETLWTCRHSFCFTLIRWTGFKGLVSHSCFYKLESLRWGQRHLQVNHELHLFFHRCFTQTSLSISNRCCTQSQLLIYYLHHHDKLHVPPTCPSALPSSVFWMVQIKWLTAVSDLWISDRNTNTSDVLLQQNTQELPWRRFLSRPVDGSNKFKQTRFFVNV